MHKQGIGHDAAALEGEGSNSIRTTGSITSGSSRDGARDHLRDSLRNNFNLACTDFLRLRRRCGRCDGCAALDSLGGSPAWLQALKLSDQQGLLTLLVHESSPNLIQQLALILAPVSSTRDAYYQSGSTFNYARDMAQERFAAAVTTPMASPPSSPARRRRSQHAQGGKQHVPRRKSSTSIPKRPFRYSAGDLPHSTSAQAMPTGRNQPSPPTLSVSRRASLTSRSHTRRHSSHIHGNEDHNSPPILTTIMEKKSQEQKTALEPQNSIKQQQQQQQPAVHRRLQSVGSVQDQLGGFGASAQLHHAATVHGLRMRSMNRASLSRRPSSSATHAPEGNDQLWHTDREGTSPANTLTMLQPATVAHLNRRLQAPGLMSKLRAATGAGQVHIDKRADHLLHWYMGASAADTARIIAWRLLLTQAGSACLQHLAGKVAAVQDALDFSSNSLSPSPSSSSTEPTSVRAPGSEQSDVIGPNRTTSSARSSINVMSPGQRRRFRPRHHASRFDILAALPRFLAQHVLSHLGDVDLETASRVSRYWRRLVASVQHHKAMRRDAVEAMMSVKRVEDTDERVTLALVSDPTMVESRPLRLPSRDVFCASFACLRLPDTPREPQHLFVAVDPTGTRTLSGGNSKHAVVRDAVSGEVIARLRGHAGGVLGGAHLIERGLYATASTDASIRLWCCKTLRPKGVLHGHIKAVTALAWYEKGDMLVSASNDRRIILWDIDRQRPCTTKHVVRASGSITGLALCPDACSVALNDGTVHVYHIERTKFVHAGCACIPPQVASSARPPSSALVYRREHHHKEEGPDEANVLATAITPHFVCAGTEDGRAFVYSRNALQGHKAAADEAELACFPHPAAVTCLRLLFLRLMTGCADGAIRLFSLPSKQCVRIFRVLGNSCPVRAFAFENLRSLAVSTDDAMALLDFGPDANAALDNVSGTEWQPLWYAEDAAHVEALRAREEKKEKEEEEEEREEEMQKRKETEQQQQAKQLQGKKKAQQRGKPTVQQKQEQATSSSEAHGHTELEADGSHGNGAIGHGSATTAPQAQCTSAMSPSPSPAMASGSWRTDRAAGERRGVSESRVGEGGQRGSLSLQRGRARTRMRSASLGGFAVQQPHHRWGAAAGAGTATTVPSNSQPFESTAMASVGPSKAARSRESRHDRSRKGSFSQASVRSRSSSNTSLGSSIGDLSESEGCDSIGPSRLSLSPRDPHKPSPSPRRVQRRSRQTLGHLYRLAVSPCRRPSSSHGSVPAGEGAVAQTRMRRTVSAMQTSGSTVDCGDEQQTWRRHGRRQRTNSVSGPTLAPHPETSEHDEGDGRDTRGASHQRAQWRQRQHQLQHLKQHEQQQQQQQPERVGRQQQSLVLSSSGTGRASHVPRRSSTSPRSHQVTDPPLAEFDQLRRTSQVSPVRRRSTFGNTFAGEWRRHYK